MLLAWVARAQALCAVGILAWLAGGIGFAARDHFLPARERYGVLPFSGAGVARALRQMLPEGRGKVLFLGGTETEAVPGSLAQIRAALEQQGCEVVQAGFEQLYAAAQGADLLCLADPQPLAQIDWPRLAAALRGRFVADFTTLAPDGAADAAGLEVIAFGRPAWPAWLDPEYLEFVRYVRTTVPEDAGILLVPGLPYRTAASRSRWFLLLNYALAPRRLELWRPELASGYVMQYFAWVDALNAARPWAEAQRIRIPERALTRLEQSPAFPTRTLAPEELRAAEAMNAEWVLFYTPNPDFRLVDWELVPLARVRGWSQ